MLTEQVCTHRAPPTLTDLLTFRTKIHEYITWSSMHLEFNRLGLKHTWKNSLSLATTQPTRIGLSGQPLQHGSLAVGQASMYSVGNRQKRRKWCCCGNNCNGEHGSRKSWCRGGGGRVQPGNKLETWKGTEVTTVGFHFSKTLLRTRE